MVGKNIWRVDADGTKAKLIAWVSFDAETGNLYWTHQNGYSDRGPSAYPGRREPATMKHYEAVLKHYSHRNDIIIEDRY